MFAGHRRLSIGSNRRAISMSFSALVDVVVHDGAEPEPCCGTSSCTHTLLQHDGHIGSVVNGKLFCTAEDGTHATHRLRTSEPCQPVTVLLEGHTHGSDCGHERIPHNDHEDYLVGDELHHVLPAPGVCCKSRCMTEAGAEIAVVLHGRVNVIRQRIRASAQHSHKQRSPLLSSTIPEITEADDEGIPVQLTVTSRIYANNICCASEARLINNILEGLPGVDKVEVAVATRMVLVRHSPQIIGVDKLVAALNAAELDATMQPPRAFAQSRHSWLPTKRVLLGLALLHYLSGPTNARWLENFQYIALGAVALAGPGVALRALQALRYRMLDINMLMTIAVIGAIAIADYVEAAAVVVLFAYAKMLEDRCNRRASDCISAMLALKPETAVVANTLSVVPVESVAVGTTVLVKPGEKVPLDGCVVAGESRVDQSVLTGESASVAKKPGDQASFCDFGISPAQKSTTERLVTTFATYYTPTVVMACVLLVVIPAAIGVDKLKDWVYLSLQVLVTACPCALVISTPVTIVAGIAKAARHGVLIKGGQHLEALAGAKLVTFDKTGTLSEGRFQVLHVEVLEPATRAKLLYFATSLEQKSAHPLAAALVGKAAAEGIESSMRVDEFVSVAGKGLKAYIDGKLTVVGNRAMLHSEGVCCDEGTINPIEERWGQLGASLCWASVGGELLGAVVVCDAARPEASEAIRSLHVLGFSCAILTGDSALSAQAVATVAGIEEDRVHAQMLPEEKLQKVKHYQLVYKQVVHVGDGVNDAPALAGADVGIAMGVGGAAVALEAAHVAIFTNDLRVLPALVRLSRVVRTVIIQNISISVVVLTLAALSYFTLWGAVLVDVGTAVLVTMNGLSVLRWRGFASIQQASGCGTRVSQRQHCAASTIAAQFHPTATPLHQRTHAVSSHAAAAAVPLMRVMQQQVTVTVVRGWKHVAAAAVTALLKWCGLDVHDAPNGCCDTPWHAKLLQ
eukprot:jgi/Chlat1/9245/Chrsp99S00715